MSLFVIHLVWFWLKGLQLSFRLPCLLSFSDSQRSRKIRGWQNVNCNAAINKYPYIYFLDSVQKRCCMYELEKYTFGIRIKNKFMIQVQILEVEDKVSEFCVCCCKSAQWCPLQVCAGLFTSIPLFASAGHPLHPRPPPPHPPPSVKVSPARVSHDCCSLHERSTLDPSSTSNVCLWVGGSYPVRSPHVVFSVFRYMPTWGV